MAMTTISDIINPQVMADMISAKIENKIVVTPFAKVDDTLVGVPGDTITVPQYAYIGDAEFVGEGETAETSTLTATSTTVTIKKAMKAVELTDEVVLAGYGNPVGEANTQIAKAIASKVDSDAMDALLTGTLSYESENTINYNDIVDAVDIFEEELNSEKVMFVHPKQMTQLRKSELFISADKYTGETVLYGEVGMIANIRIVMSKKVKLNDEGTHYINPIIKLQEKGDEDDAPALTIYLKRDTNVETQRNTLSRTTAVSADKFYTVALSNASKVVLASFLKEEA
ncbi:MAG: N4-gp56 family major capsid protein [Clostridia bacterium]|nr:N4-gp56 family major capsid protein [Clostridia bacterium]